MRVYEASLQYHLVEDGQTDTPIDSPERVVRYLRNVFEENPVQEAFWVILLDVKNFPLGRLRVSLGTLTGSLVHPREVFKAAILASASGIIAAHNHPSGNPAPSSADIKVTRTLRQASQIIDIQLLDHVIVGDRLVDPNGKGYYSFADAGLI